jgi:hypothetical protein
MLIWLGFNLFKGNTIMANIYTTKKTISNRQKQIDAASGRGKKKVKQPTLAESRAAGIAARKAKAKKATLAKAKPRKKTKKA